MPPWDDPQAIMIMIKFTITITKGMERDRVEHGLQGRV